MDLVGGREMIQKRRGSLQKQVVDRKRGGISMPQRE